MTTEISSYDAEGREVTIGACPAWLSEQRPGCTHTVTVDDRTVFEGHAAGAVRVWRTLTASDLGALGALDRV